MMRKLLLFLAAAVPAFCAVPLPEKADLLAENTVVAQYMGVQERACHFRTALCPDRCGHATRVALFRIRQNEHYAKYGEYGDAKANAGAVLVLGTKGDVPGQPDDVKALLASLKPGDVVRLTQKHYYADFGTVVEPVRPVTAAEKLGSEPVPAEKPADPDAGVMPLAL